MQGRSVGLCQLPKGMCMGEDLERNKDEGQTERVVKGGGCM